jgi:hypothetical protein
MSSGFDRTPATIGSQWIKAHMVGAIINIALTLVAFLIGQVLGVNEQGASPVVQAGFVVAATAALAFGLVVLGYLSGVVLRTKLPAFPMRNWLALYVVLGVVFGLISAIAWLTPETSAELTPVDADSVVSLAIGAAVAGAGLATIVGLLQALILRPAAEGLGFWIACSAIAGALFLLLVPAVIYGPQSGFGQEFMVELGTLVVTILAAVILLPAVHHLRPR